MKKEGRYESRSALLPLPKTEIQTSVGGMAAIRTCSTVCGKKVTMGIDTVGSQD